MMDTSARTSGTLYIVATPIGNRDDISLRALNVLKSVDIIIAEDTRHSKPLLVSYGINKPLTSLHAHNESNKTILLIQQLLQGQSCALISDAGTPLISDPGFPIVKLAHAHNIPVVPIPGACALITALSAAGVPCEIFTFAGFLPAKQAARLQILKRFQSISHTVVFYESTHRIEACLDDIETVFGEQCELVLAKELTKAFERFIHGNSTQIKTWLLSDKSHSKGEFVLIIPARPAVQETTEIEQLLKSLLAELPLKQAVKIASQLSNIPKNQVYDLALSLQTK